MYKLNEDVSYSHYFEYGSIRESEVYISQYDKILLIATIRYNSISLKGHISNISFISEVPMNLAVELISKLNNAIKEIFKEIDIELYELVAVKKE